MLDQRPPSRSRRPEAKVACADVLQIIASVRGAVDGLVAEAIEDHIRCDGCAPSPGAHARAEGADDLIEILRSYFEMNPPAVR
jgi:FrmR/RcnR family transcriptional regulator, repressor of frmRAB operon